MGAVFQSRTTMYRCPFLPLNSSVEPMDFNVASANGRFRSSITAIGLLRLDNTGRATIHYGTSFCKRAKPAANEGRVFFLTNSSGFDVWGVSQEAWGDPPCRPVQPIHTGSVGMFGASEHRDLYVSRFDSKHLAIRLEVANVVTIDEELMESFRVARVGRSVDGQLDGGPAPSGRGGFKVA